jgi:hypothetical protein
MKTKLLLMCLLLFASNIYSQKTAPVKWRNTETDTLTVAQAMFDDQNFVMAYPYLNQLQKNHPTEPFLMYLTGISALFKTGTQEQGLEFLLMVYENNKNAEDIEFYLSLAYQYNQDFDKSIVMANKFLARKHLTQPQIRSGQKVKDFSTRKEVIVPAPDEGKLDDYVKLIAEDEEQRK